MNQIIFILIISIVFYIIFKVAAKEPIIPTKNKNAQRVAKGAEETKSALKMLLTKEEELGALDEFETAPFEEMFPDVVGIESHMLRHTNNRFTMVAEVTPVNFYLRDDFEQKGININYETWLAQVNDVRIYLQNRFVDLKESIDNIKQNVQNDENLNVFAREYASAMIRDLEFWQRSQPRYELKRFLLFDYQVNVNDIKTENLTEEQIDQKIIDKAFNECKRRFFAARSQLKKAEIGVDMLSGDGIIELAYYSFNRRKAQKNRYRDIESQEQAAMYVTADTLPETVAAVKMLTKREKEDLAKGSNMDNFGSLDGSTDAGEVHVTTYKNGDMETDTSSDSSGGSD